MSTTSQCLQWARVGLLRFGASGSTIIKAYFFPLKKKEKSRQNNYYSIKSLSTLSTPHCGVDSVELQLLVNIFTPSSCPCQDIFMPFNLSAENSWRQLTVSNRMMITVIGHWLGSFNCTKYSIMSVKVWELQKQIELLNEHICQPWSCAQNLPDHMMSLFLLCSLPLQT